MCLDHCEKILSKHTSDETQGTDPNNHTNNIYNINAAASGNPPVSTAMSTYERATHNDIVDDMMSISGAFGTMDGFPFDMTGIWDISGLQDQDSSFMSMGQLQ